MKNKSTQTIVLSVAALFLATSCASESKKNNAPITDPDSADSTPAPTITLGGNSHNIAVNASQSLELVWDSKGGTNCTVKQQDSLLSSNSSGSKTVTVNPVGSESIYFRISCTAANNVIKDASVYAYNSNNISNGGTSDTFVLLANGSANSVNVTSGSDVELTWDYPSGTTNCIVDMTDVNYAVKRWTLPKVTKTREYGMVCYGASNAVIGTKKVQVNVAGDTGNIFSTVLDMIRGQLVK